MYSFILFNGYLRFYCKDYQCEYNEKGLCKMRHLNLPDKIICPLREKRKIKIFVDLQFFI